ncbi:TIGR02266 family protein [Thermodesulfobacteriota bacterium]
MEDERRKTPRIETNIEIMFKEKGSFIKAYMINVSNGGVFIKTENPLPLEAPVHLKMNLPGENEYMDIRGMVVWSNPKGTNNAFPNGMGIQFVTVQPDDKAKIQEFVDENKSEIKRKSIF